MAIKFSPHGYQHLIINHIHAVPRCAVWAGMGMGKSVSTATALESLSLVEDVYPVLILGPLRVIRTTWPGEFRKWEHLKHLKVSVITGTAPQRIAACKVKADVYTANFEQLPWLVEHFGERWPFRVVVIDESTKLKGFRLRQGTTRAKALARVAFTKIKRVIELTGTPSPNGLVDLWGQTWFLDKGERLGKTMEAFKQRWFRPARNGHGIEALEHAQEQIQKALKDVCITVDAADWFDLELPIKNRIMVDLPPKAEVLYREMEKRMFMELASGEKIEALNAAAKTQKCLQVASGAAYTGGGNTAWEVIHDEKLDALDEILEEACGMPVLVAYHFKSDLARLKARYKDGIDLGTKDGLDRAIAGEGRVWFGHPESMGHGVDGLQYHSNIMVFFSVNWALEPHLQVIERIGPTRQHQAGKRRPVFVHYILARDTMDELVMDRLESKREVQDILLEAMKVREAA